MTEGSLPTSPVRLLAGERGGWSRRGLVLYFALAAGAVLLMLLPALASDAALGAVDRAMIAAVFALAFNLLAGQAGMLSFGHAAYFAVGAFATVHAMIAIEHSRLWLPTPLVPLAGGVGGFLFAGVAGFFATKRSGVYFAMVTLAIAELLHTLAPNLEGLFGGEAGLSSFRQPFMGVSFGKEMQVYYLTVGWTAASVVLLWAYTHSLFGRLTLACRETEKRLPSLGFNVHHTKILIFAISGLFSGLAGGLLAFSTESANYELFQSSVSAMVVLQTFIGGTGLFLGPALGAFFLTLFGRVASDLTRSWLLYQGLLFIVVMVLAPHGVGRWMVDEAEALAGGGRAALRLACILAAVLVAATGVVMLAELSHTLLSRDYEAIVTRTASYPPIPLFGRSWDPASPLTWLAPLALFATAALLAIIGRRFGQARA